MEGTCRFNSVHPNKVTKSATVPNAPQVPVDNWHACLKDPTLADAILDRLVHNSHRINLRGESQRKLQAGKLPDTYEKTI